MHNRSYGFVYLINKQGEVVWRCVSLCASPTALRCPARALPPRSAHGLPEDGELTAMSDAASKLA